MNVGVSEKVGPQAFIRCVSAEACAENHQVPTDVKGKSFSSLFVYQDLSIDFLLILNYVKIYVHPFYM